MLGAKVAELGVGAQDVDAAEDGFVVSWDSLGVIDLSVYFACA